MSLDRRLYASPHQAEPWLPGEGRADGVLAQAHALQMRAARVQGKADASVMQALAPLLRAMNSYYTNKIEGQHTLPSDIASALAQQFSPDLEVQRRQRLAVAHMRTEQWAEQTYGQHDWQSLLAPDVIRALHRHLFAQLPDEDRRLSDGSVMQPGAWRTGEVRVGQHEAPMAASVPIFLAHFESTYRRVRPGEMALVVAATAHHRLAWIHPFADGNGRVVRLHSHVLLHAMGLTNGVWSPLRGLARSQPRYDEMLALADMPRHGDLDGRGNLSEKQLLAFIDYFLTTCADQASFMSSLLDFPTLRERIRACLAFESSLPGSPDLLRAELPLYQLFLTGATSRGEFKQLTALAPRSADKLVRRLLERELLHSDSPKGKLQFGLPLHALRFYFPALWPEAEAQASTDRIDTMTP